MLIKQTKSDQPSIPIDWQNILSQLGYKISGSNDEFRCQAVYRQGNNPSSIKITPSSGQFYDFGNSEHGSIIKLIALTKGVEEYEVNEATEKLSLNPKLKFSEVIDIPKTYSEDCLKSLLKDYSYFESRGISAQTQKIFEVGVATRGPLYGRIVFPIRSIVTNKIIGWTGRDPKWVKKSEYSKWLILRPKRHFVYNFKTATQSIRESKTLILLESVGDLLSCYESGVKNCLCLFGLSLGKEMFKYILSMNPSKIIISTNKDGSSNDNAGEKGAVKLQDKLSRYFNENKIKIILPPILNDWNDILVSEGPGFIKDWYNSVK